MLTLGIVQTNCYIVGDTDTHQAVIFDAPDSAPKILAVLKAESWTLTDILLTHSHFDHILAVGNLKAATGAQVRLHSDDLEQYRMLPEHMQIFHRGTLRRSHPNPIYWLRKATRLPSAAWSSKCCLRRGIAPGM